MEARERERGGKERQRQREGPILRSGDLNFGDSRLFFGLEGPETARNGTGGRLEA